MRTKNKATRLDGLLAKIGLARIAPQKPATIEPPEECPEWTREEIGAMRAFADSPTGLRLRRELRAMSLRVSESVRNCRPGGEQRAVGYAHGYAVCASIIEQICAVSAGDPADESGTEEPTDSADSATHP